jgi:hypothetical protein
MQAPHTQLAADFISAIANGLQGKSLTTCSRWAAQRIVMGGDFPGPYSTKFHPWVREILDSKAEFNTAMKAAQMGFTVVGMNRSLFAVDQEKRNALYVLPTSQVASDFSRDRFGSALELSPYLKALFTDTNSVGLKRTATSSLYIRGSRGESNLVSIPASVLVLDEVDRMSQKKINLALTRLDGQLSRLVWAISTPTVPDYGVHSLYLKSTQEHFVFRCPSCSRLTELIWPDCVEIIGESSNDVRRHESFLKCKECKAKLPHEAKPEFLSQGFWQPTIEGGDPDHRGFWIPQLYSYVKTPGKLVGEYFLGQGDEAAATEFWNSKLGLPYVAEGAQVTDDLINASIGEYTTQDPRPRDGRRLITMGIDQGKICYWTVCEWFFDQFSQDLNATAHCKVLAHGTFLETDWAFADQLLWEWQVLTCVVDADPDISEARRFAKRFNDETECVYLCRYRNGKTAKEIGLSEEHTGSPIATVDRTNWLTGTLGRFRMGRIKLPRDVSADYREHMKSLVRTYEKNDDGDMEVVFKKRGPDHYAHSLNYAEIGLPLAASKFTGENVGKFL